MTEELKYVKDYLVIQQTRFGDRISIVYEISDEVRNAKLPKFTIQPLVENAIVHGLEPQKDGGTLLVKADRQGNSTIIEVIDTGVGIPEAEMEALRKFDQEYNSAGEYNGLGLFNVP